MARRAEKVLSDTIPLSEIEAIDIQVWKVPISKEYAEGIRCSYNYRLYTGEKWIDVMRWDNYHSSGSHVDIRDPETGEKMTEVGTISKSSDI